MTKVINTESSLNLMKKNQAQLKGAVEKPVKLHFHFREQRSQSWRSLTQHTIQMDQFLLHNHVIIIA